MVKNMISLGQKLVLDGNIIMHFTTTVLATVNDKLVR